MKATVLTELPRGEKVVLLTGPEHGKYVSIVARLDAAEQHLTSAVVAYDPIPLTRFRKRPVLGSLDQAHLRALDGLPQFLAEHTAVRQKVFGEPKVTSFDLTIPPASKRVDAVLAA